MKKTYLSNDAISSLCLELSALLHAGIGAADGIHLLKEDAAPAELPLLSALGERLDAGQPLSAAMTAAGGFPPYVTGLTEVGERSGRLEESLRALSAYYDNQERLSQQIRGALLYPAILLLLMLIVIAVLLVKVLPVFNEVYESLGGELTGLAGGLLALGRGLDTAMPVLCALLALTVLFLAAFSSLPAFRDKLSAAWRARHGDRGISRGVFTARFAQAMSLCLRSGLPAEAALDLTQTLLGDYPAAGMRIRDCRSRLDHGAGLAEALRNAGLLPAAYSRMLALGIRSGTGDAMMEELARRLLESSELEIERRVGRVEPTLVIVTSVLVGVILLSVMLPLMNIMATVG